MMTREEYLHDYYEERAARKRTACQCSREDWPGSCPGVHACPMARPDDEDEEDGDEH